MKSADGFDSAAVASLVKQNSGPGVPPVNSWHPDLSGDIDLRIDRQGLWYHEGVRFERQALARMFASILRKEGDAYFVLTPVEKWRIRVEDVPFLITEMELLDAGPNQRLQMTTSLGDCFCIDAEHPLWLDTDPTTDEPSPYVRVRDRLDGLLSRAVFYRLVELAGEHQIDGVTRFGIQSSGQFFALADADEPC